MEVKQSSGRYLINFKNNIPNLITIINLILGYLSIVMVLQGNIKLGSLIILWAMVFDGMDGKVARILGMESSFGKQLDSLSDLVSFGVAPAFLLYESVLIEFGVIGFVVTAFIPIAGAIRLARFNILPSQEFFKGLPITIAGGTAASLPLVIGLSSTFILIATVLFSFLMISSISYSKYTNIFSSKRANILFILFNSTLFITMVWFQLITFVFGLLSFYILSGIVCSFIQYRSHEKEETQN